MESNGPDVRIRGTAAHIAEKYSQLANDAQTAGDTVSAQSYWQFAEHYNRLVAAAQAAQQQAREARGERNERGDGRKNGDNDGDSGNQEERGRGRHNRNVQAEDGNKDEATVDQHAKSPESVNGEEPQSDLIDTPAEVVLTDKNAGEAPAEKGEKPAKASKPRRARKPKEEVAATASDDAGGLPAFVTGTD